MDINNFSDFCITLLQCGFSMGGGNAKGIFAVVPYGWENQDCVDSPVKWHTGDAETDPWEWRMRVLEERDDIAYSKVFFKTSGYITKEWYPYFFAIRRGGETLEEAYLNGTVSRMARRIYSIISENGIVAMHEIKQLGGFSKEENSEFERAVTELQMRMFITMCGRARKTNKQGEGYGWSSTVFTTSENFWEQRGMEIEAVNRDKAFEKIEKQIYLLNPEAEKRKISKFIIG